MGVTSQSQRLQTRNDHRIYGVIFCIVSLFLCCAAQAVVSTNLPTGWSAVDIGTTATPESTATYSGNTFAITSAAGPFSGTATTDNCVFVYQAKSGPFDIVGRFDTLAPYSDNDRMALMVRETLNADSRYASVWRCARSVGVAVRRTAAAATQETGKTWALTTNGGTLPEAERWYRIVRSGDTIMIYRSASCDDWRHPYATYKLSGLASTVYLGMAVGFKTTGTTVSAGFTYSSINSYYTGYYTTWLGQTCNGVEGINIPMNVQGLAVDPSTGKQVSICFWDEQGPNSITLDTNGTLLTGRTDLNASLMGSSIAIGGSYFYIGTSRSGYSGVRRFNLSDSSPATWTGAEDTNFLKINTAGSNPFGLAVNTTTGELFISDTSHNVVQVYSTSTMAKLREFNVDRPNQLALDTSGNIWVVQQEQAYTLGSVPQLLRFPATATGTPSPERIITNIGNPQGICYDGPRNRLLVCDAGVDQQVKIYTATDIANANITLTAPSSTFGAQGGIYSGTSGQVGGLKFNGPIGIGVDNGGAVYLVCSQNFYQFDYSKNPPMSNEPAPNGLGAGTEFYKFSSTAATTPSWTKYCLEGMSNADLDPGDENSVYSQTHKYTMDWTRMGNASESTYAAMTLDPFRYPHDLRFTEGSLPGGVRMGRKDGYKFLFYWRQAGSSIMAYRFASGSEVAIPCSAFFGSQPSTGDYPPNRQAVTDQRLIWRDLDGDGQMDDGEYLANPDIANMYYNAKWFVDDNCDMWVYYQGFSIRRYQSTVDPTTHALLYSATSTNYTLPSEVTSVLDLFYVPATDTMYLLAGTKIRPGAGNYYNGPLPTEVLRYDGWTGTRTLVWRVPAYPYNPVRRDQVSGHEIYNLTHMSVAGNYVYVASSGNSTIYMLETSTGGYKCALSAGAEVAGRCGLFDIPRSVNARLRTSGGYLYTVFAEENENNKVLIYRDGGFPPPGPVVNAAPASSTQINLTWNDSSNQEGSYRVEYALDPNGPFFTAGTAAANATSFAHTGLTAGTTYYYRVRANNGNGDSMFAQYAAATTYGLTPTLPVKINFQPLYKPDPTLSSDPSKPWVAVSMPDGYLADAGDFYSAKGSNLAYGWSDDIYYHTKDVDSTNSPDQLHDTYVNLYDVPGRKWQIALPNGTYQVKIVAGDPVASGTNTYKIMAENVLVIDGTVNSTTKWLENTATVTVSDGMLTITPGTGNSNTMKICAIEISL